MQLGIDQAMRRLGAKHRFEAWFERILFALIANRALAPSSELAAAEWISHDVHIPGLPKVAEDACYRAMDWLLEIEPELAREVYFATTHLLNLKVGLLFFDTTSTYFQIEDLTNPSPATALGAGFMPERRKRCWSRGFGFRQVQGPS